MSPGRVATQPHLFSPFLSFSAFARLFILSYILLQELLFEKSMPHGGCCRGKRTDGSDGNGSAEGDFFVGDAPLHYAPSTHLEIVSTHIRIDLTEMKAKKAFFEVTHKIQCNNVKFRAIELNGLGTQGVSIRITGLSSTFSSFFQVFLASALLIRVELLSS